MFNSRILLILLLPLLLGSNCCKKNKKTYYMDQEFKDYIVFNSGSYWVYQDSLDSSKIDSVTLTSQEIEIVETKHFDFDYEAIYQNYYSTKSTYLTNGNVIGGELDKTNLSSYIFSIGGITHFFSQASIGEINDVELLYENYLDSININNNAFNKVKIFKFQEDYISNYPEKIYYSSHVGIIKKEMYDGTVWELIRYNIVQ